MKKLFKNIIVAVLLSVFVFLGVVAAEKFFPGETYILKNIFTNYKYRSSLEKVEIETEGKKLAELLEICEVNDSLLLINEDYKLPENYFPDLIDLSGKVYVNSAIKDSYWDLKAAVKEKFDTSLYIMSSYRSPEEQEEIINSGNEFAAKEGASEHLTGLALDVYVPYHAGMGFIDTDEGKFVNENCGDYGFIIRYPSYGEVITKIPYEPWHIRYVGLPHSKIIAENKITLEEYILSFKDEEFYSYENYLISRQKEGSLIYLPEELTDIVLSYDNTGYLIITGKR